MVANTCADLLTLAVRIRTHVSAKELNLTTISPNPKRLLAIFNTSKHILVLFESLSRRCRRSTSDLETDVLAPYHSKSSIYPREILSSSDRSLLDAVKPITCILRDGPKRSIAKWLYSCSPVGCICSILV